MNVFAPKAGRGWGLQCQGSRCLVLNLVPYLCGLPAPPLVLERCPAGCPLPGLHSGTQVYMGKGLVRALGTSMLVLWLWKVTWALAEDLSPCLPLWQEVAIRSQGHRASPSFYKALVGADHCHHSAAAPDLTSGVHVAGLCLPSWTHPCSVTQPRWVSCSSRSPAFWEQSVLLPWVPALMILCIFSGPCLLPTVGTRE